MKSLKEHFTVDELRSMFTYNPETGDLLWNIDRRNGSIPRGGVAGSLRIRTGYLNLIIQNKNVLAHRVAWALHYGAWPAGLIDHANGVRHDNRIANLRLATISQNAANSGPRSNNKLGVKGVFVNKHGWYEATIYLNGKNKCLGTFRQITDADNAYKAASQAAFGDFAIHRR